MALSGDLADAFAVLGVPESATRSTLRRRYKALVRKWHPDRFIGDPQRVLQATERLQAINRAYDTIRANWADEEPDRHDRLHQRTSTKSEPTDLDRDAVEEIIAAVNARESLWEQMKCDPLNRLIPVILAAGDLVWSMREYMVSPPISGKSAVLLSVGTSVIFVPWVWAQSGRQRMLGWCGLLYFKVLFPSFALLTKAFI